jgi:amino acid transporter
MSVAEIRGKSNAFERNIRVRNAIEYSAAVIVLISFGYQAFVAPNIYMRAGSLLIVLGTLFVVYFLHTRGSAQNVPAELGLSASRDFHRASLERQRDLLRSVWRWYLLPFVPGMAINLFGFAVRDGVFLNQPSPVSQQGAGGLAILILAVAMVVFFFFVNALNNRWAKKLQAQIDALDE